MAIDISEATNAVLNKFKNVYAELGQQMQSAFDSLANATDQSGVVKLRQDKSNARVQYQRQMQSYQEEIRQVQGSARSALRTSQEQGTAIQQELSTLNNLDNSFLSIDQQTVFALSRLEAAVDLYEKLAESNRIMGESIGNQFGTAPIQTEKAFDIPYTRDWIRQVRVLFSQDNPEIANDLAEILGNSEELIDDMLGSAQNFLQQAAQDNARFKELVSQYTSATPTNIQQQMQSLRGEHQTRQQLYDNQIRQEQQKIQLNTKRATIDIGQNFLESFKNIKNYIEELSGTIRQMVREGQKMLQDIFPLRSEERINLAVGEEETKYDLMVSNLTKAQKDIQALESVRATQTPAMLNQQLANLKQSTQGLVGGKEWQKLEAKIRQAYEAGEEFGQALNPFLGEITSMLDRLNSQRDAYLEKFKKRIAYQIESEKTQLKIGIEQKILAPFQGIEYLPVRSRQGVEMLGGSLPSFIGKNTEIQREQARLARDASLLEAQKYPELESDLSAKIEEAFNIESAGIEFGQRRKLTESRAEDEVNRRIEYLEKLSKLSTTGRGQRYDAEIQQLQIHLDYLKKANEQREIAAKFAAAGKQYPLAEELAALEKLKKLDLRGVATEIKDLFGEVKTGIQGSIEEGIDALIKGTDSLKDIVANFLRDILTMIAGTAAKFLASESMGFLEGIFGVRDRQGAGGEKLNPLATIAEAVINPTGEAVGVSDFLGNKEQQPKRRGFDLVKNQMLAPTSSLGKDKWGWLRSAIGLATSAYSAFSSFKAPNIGNFSAAVQPAPYFSMGGAGVFGGAFAEGGTIQSQGAEKIQKVGDLLQSFSKAMRREGPLAIPVVASKGEEVLSVKNGDAPLFRELKSSGVWQDIKNTQKHYNYINNYQNGGTIGVIQQPYNPPPKPRSNASRIGGAININVTTPNADSFRRSEGLIGRDIAERMRRQHDRNS